MENNKMITFHIGKKDESKSVADFLNGYHVSRKTAYLYGVEHKILVNHQVKRSDVKLKYGDILSFIIDTDEKLEVSKESIDVVYEDDDIIVVNKPTDLLVHSDGNKKDHLTARVQHYLMEKGEYVRCLATHRIDYETSGIVLFAKHFIVLSHFSYQFEHHQVKKTYACIVEGVPLKKRARIDDALKKDNKLGIMVVNKHGKKALTDYQVVKTINQDAYLDVTIQTGKTHQIRAHLSSIGHAVKGDRLYGNSGNRLYLHFKEISFKHPISSEMMTLKTEVPF